MNEKLSDAVPTFEQREAMWRALDFPVHAAGQYPRVEEYMAALRGRYTNGHVLFHSFSIPQHPVFDWYFKRNLLRECNFFEKFWSAPSPAAILRQQPAPLNYYETSLFQWTSPFNLGGDLSWIIFSGGAYSRSNGYGREAHRLGEGASADLLGSDFEETLVYQCGSAWSGFFMDVAWDCTVIVISKPFRLVHVMLATDTD